jgi:ribosomal protein L17
MITVAGHRLGHRRDLEERVAVDGQRMLDTRHAVRRHFDRVGAKHADRDTGYVVALHRIADEGVERRVHQPRC